MDKRANLSIFLAANAAILLALCAIAQAEDQPLKFKAEATVKETFDDNVFIQDHGATAAPRSATGPQVALANKSSLVTSAMPTVGLSYKPSDPFNLLLTYSPEVVFYHSYSSEDYTAHRVALNMGGQFDDTVWELLNGFSMIDGNEFGPRFFGDGAVPAIGGIPLRDRRDAMVTRNSFRLTQTFGDFFVRPVGTFYLHDFQTKQFTAAEMPGYENYVDRYDYNAGADVGYKVAEKTWAVVGYRYGHQHQGELNGQESAFSNDYQRILAGIEGAPFRWLKLNLMAGPDIRNFSNTLLNQGDNRRFRKNEILYYVDASASIIPTKNDVIAIRVTRFEQPAFSSQSMYQDIRYDVSWKHKFNEQISASLGMLIYVGDWQAPVYREDWIYTPYTGVTYAFNKHWSAEAAYSYDTAVSMIPKSRSATTEGREFTRNLATLGVKYVF